MNSGLVFFPDEKSSFSIHWLAKKERDVLSCIADSSALPLKKVNRQTVQPLNINFELNYVTFNLISNQRRQSENTSKIDSASTNGKLSRMKHI